MIFWVSSFCAAWTPCCASHASSALPAWSWRPLMPPAVLMSATASSPAFRIAMPGSAYGPVKGPVIPTLIGPELLALLPPLPQAAINSAPQAARLAATNRRLNIVPPYPFVVAHRHLPVRVGARVRRRQATTPWNWAQYRYPVSECQGRSGLGFGLGHGAPASGGCHEF